MRKLDWYFDFISPFSYLQSELLHTLPVGVDISFMPVLFAGLLRHWDNKGPAEMPEQLLAAGGLRATNVPILSAQLPANPRTRNISEHVYSKPAMPGIRTDCGFAACAGAGA